jgi:NADH-quinone oxidoreductase subunit J
MQLALFVAAGLVLLGGAVGVLLTRNALHAALSLIVALAASAVLYLLLAASFVAAMQVLVYAGAIMVLFVFVILLLNLGEAGARVRGGFIEPIGALAAVTTAGLIGYPLLLHSSASPADIDATFGTVGELGELLLTDYLFGFEAVSLLLLVAVVGAIVLGLRRLT